MIEKHIRVVFRLQARDEAAINALVDSVTEDIETMPSMMVEFLREPGSWQTEDEHTSFVDKHGDVRIGTEIVGIQ